MTVNRQVFMVGGASLTLAGQGHAQSHDPVTSFANVEQLHGGRLGIFALYTQTGRSLAYRADERFSLMSSFKGLLSAMILSDVAKGRDSLDAPVHYQPSDLIPVSPVTQANVARGTMTVGELCEAIMHRSDNTAANLLLRRSGGPARLTAFLRSIGDTVSRIDHYEGDLTGHPLPADSTTPRAVTEAVRQIMLGSVLPTSAQRQWEGWMAGNVVGRTRLRAGFPADWISGDRSGTGDGICNDFAFARRPAAAPLLLSVYYAAPGSELADQEAVLRKIARLVVQWLTPLG
jgi:beta-lactamase class A